VVLARIISGLTIAGALYLAVDLSRSDRPARRPVPEAASESPPELRLFGWPRRVDWQEFQTRRTHPWGKARTLASIRSTLEVRGLEIARVDGETWGVQRADVSVGVERGHSWVKEGERSEYVRAHEQGHFDITGLIAREWLDHVQQVRAASQADAQAQVEQSFAALAEKLALLQRLYDHDTSGGEEPQRAWLARIERAIARGEPLPPASRFPGYGALGASRDPY